MSDLQNNPLAMFVKPARAGLKVPYPAPANPHTYLPDAGDTVPRDFYWLRVLADGDIVEMPAPAAKPAKPEPLSKKKDA